MHVPHRPAHGLRGQAATVQVTDDSAFAQRCDPDRARARRSAWCRTGGHRRRRCPGHRRARSCRTPSLTASYSRSVPRYHFTVDVPLDFPISGSCDFARPGLASTRRGSGITLARAKIALDADTTYTRALAARERLALSQRSALDADSVLHMVAAAS